jgi:diguanylate cyclase (GGDEF)-like protein
MTDIGEIQKNETKPGVQFKRIKKKYIPHRDTVLQTFKDAGEDPKRHKRLTYKLARQAMENKAENNTDELTGLLTRKAFINELNAELELGKEFNTSSTLIILDANGLKQINDSKGHPAGDELLKKIGKHIKDGTRVTDLAGRLGGDEFAVLLTDTDLETSKTWWDRLNEKLEADNISISAGSREIFAREVGIKTVEEFTNEADQQMYISKNWHKIHGKNFYTGVGPNG